MLLCVDLGNTHTHYGLVGPDRVPDMAAVPTRLLDHAVDGLGPRLMALLRDRPNLEGAAFCSVVPAATPRLRRALEAAGFSRPVFQLTPAAALGLPVTYPNPAEIGHDRLANAAGAHALRGSPAIVIDSGTAVTFDIVTRRGGYEGGIIAPGTALMRRYLHEKTAQLPLLGDEPGAPASMIGRSTAEAMRIGLTVGFTGLIQALLDATLAELAAAGEPIPALLATGGDAGWLSPRLRQPCAVVPDLTLRGLAVAWALNR